MSDVLIRCPNCGTTQAALGECEACHEAQVRYFCTNHDPGRWLDGPACPACGARYGMERGAGRPGPPGRSGRPVAQPEPPPSRRPAEGSERVPVDAWHGPVRTPEFGEVVEIEGGTVDPRRGDPIELPFPPDAVRLATTASGCVRRLVILFVILFALTALVVFGLLGIGIRLL